MSLQSLCLNLFTWFYLSRSLSSSVIALKKLSLWCWRLVQSWKSTHFSVMQDVFPPVAGQFVHPKEIRSAATVAFLKLY